MRNLLVHNPINRNHRHYRNYNLFFDDLTDSLRDKYNVVENRKLQNESTPFTSVSLKSVKIPINMLECEYIIEDMDSGEFWILSVADQLTPCILREKNNPLLKKVLYSHYVPDQMVHHFGENTYKYSPWIYFPQDAIDYNYFFLERKEIKPFLPKLFFKGNTSYRPIIDLINKNILSENFNSKIDNISYCKLLLKHKICLSVGGAALSNMCYRDIECMAMGVPVLRFEHNNILSPNLIPNYHYISIPLSLDIPKENDLYKDRLGKHYHAKMIENRFMEVLENDVFLDFIVKNAKDYYNSFLLGENRVNHTLKLLSL